MAQRAYRQRKESTLDDLRKRVSDLTTTIECMNRAFEGCRDRLVSAGLPESQLDDLAELSVRFVGFMKPVRQPGEAPDCRTADELLSTSMDNVNTMRQEEELPLVPTGKNVPSWLDQSTLSHREKGTQQPDIGMGYTMYMPAAFDQLADNFRVPTLAQAMAAPAAEPSSTDLFGDLGSSVPNQHSLSLEQELVPPKTYSFQETTLARRLHRACLESAYHLLLDPSRRPHTYERVFKLSVLSRDRVRMAASLKRILDRGLEDPLDFWDAPLLHIGGAGTHYPRREEIQTMQPRKPVFHLGMIGPQMLNLLENVVQARPNVDISVEIAGFEGEWFDPYDIEGYLESKGIHIDPTVSFVEAEITDFPEISLGTSTGSSTRTSTGPGSRTSTSNWDPDQWSELQGIEADLARWQEIDNVQVNGLSDVGFSDTNTGSWMNLQPSADQTTGKTTPMGMPYGQPYVNGLHSSFMGYGQAAVVPPEPTKKVVIIDVAKFVKGESTLDTAL